MTKLFDCARLWARLPPAAQARLGEAAVLYIIAGIGQADALDADDMRRSRFYDIADGIAIDALSQRLDEALRREEERGFARGLRDARTRALRIIADVKAPLHNGGARNACDAIAGAIEDANVD
jgi:hypothetical protein